jgi:hypothetical protein
METETMKLKLLIAALGLAALPVLANEYVVRDVTIAPPEPPNEVMPAPRAGYVWAPGYYDYAQNKHHWHKGHWVQERKGYRYEAPRWAQENGRWNLSAENWVKDEDAKTPSSEDRPHVHG